MIYFSLTFSRCLPFDLFRVHIIITLSVFQYVGYARTYVNPKLTPAAAQVLQVKWRTKGQADGRTGGRTEGAPQSNKCPVITLPHHTPISLDLSVVATFTVTCISVILSLVIVLFCVFVNRIFIWTYEASITVQTAPLLPPDSLSLLYDLPRCKEYSWSTRP